MTLGIGQLGGAYTPQAVPARTRFAPAPPAAVEPSEPADRVELSAAAPPPEVLEEVEFAYKRALDLAAQNRELHFSKDEETGRVIVQVRDLEGRVIRTIPPSDAMAVMAGAEL